MSRELTRTSNWRIVWRYGSKLVIYINTLPNLLAICIVVSEIWWLYFITWSCKTIWLKSHVILREVFPQTKSPSGAKFRSHKPCGRGNIVVLVCHLISQDHTMKKSAPRHYRRWGGASVPTQEKKMWLYGWELLMVSHHPAKFGSKIPHACSNRHYNAHGMEAHSILC